MKFEEFQRRFQKVPVVEYPNNVLLAVPEPIITVKISTFQHAKFIRNCLEGVLMQRTSFPFEVIIGEDNSTDGTRELCIEYAEKYPDLIRLFLHSDENKIYINGRKTGKFQSYYSTLMARGKFVATCEGDDYWTDAEKLEQQASFMLAHPEYVLTGHPYRDVDVETGVDHGVQTRKDQSLTTMVKNVQTRRPVEFFQTVNGDTFSKLLLSRFGRFGYIETIAPAVRRMHRGGIWSKQSEEDKILMSIHSRKMMVKAFPLGKGSLRNRIALAKLMLRRQTKPGIRVSRARYFVEMLSNNCLLLTVLLVLKRTLFGFKTHDQHIEP